MPTNFKTYEAQSRLLVAVLASDPNLRLNFKAIAQHFGSDTTESGIEHRFRPLKKHAQAVRQAVVEGKDPYSMAGVIGAGGKEIAKYYGESTPAGLEFQFRSVKKDAKAVREAVAKGESPLSTARKTGGAGSSATTPQSGTKRKSTASTPQTGGSAAKRGRKASAKAAAPVDSTDSNEDEEGRDEIDYEELDITPTRAPKPKMQQQSRPPPAQPQFRPAPARIQQQQQPDLQHYQSVEQPMHTSIFGNGSSRPMSTPGLSLEATPSEEDFGFPSPAALPVPSPTAGVSMQQQHMRQPPAQQYHLSSLASPHEDSGFYAGSDLWGKESSHGHDGYGVDDDPGAAPGYSFDFGEV